MPRVGRQNNHAKSASSLVLCGRSARSPRGEMRASRAPQSSETLIPAFRSHSRRPGAVSVKRSLGQRRGVERAPRWPQRQLRQVCKRARAPWADGLFSTERGARGPCGTGCAHFGYVFLKSQPPTERGVGEVELRPTAWVGAHPALGAKTTMPTPPARTYSAGGRLVLHGAKRARATRHQIRKIGLEHPDAAVGDLARCR